MDLTSKERIMLFPDDDESCYRCVPADQHARELGFKDFEEFKAHSLTVAELLSMTAGQRDSWIGSCRTRLHRV
jgi:hypothetical protein